jgi:hypothetical protein
MASWRSWAATTDGAFTGLIVGRSNPVSWSDDGWASPAIAAYVDRAGDFEQIPVTLESEWTRREAASPPRAKPASQASWRLGPPDWFLGNSATGAMSESGLYLTATRSAGDSSNWVERSQPGPNGTSIRWRERPKPGKSGVVERAYIDNVTETGPVTGGVELLWR